MYSQCNEEEFIAAATAHIERGRFLDIGAFHSKIFSNTRALYERGWSGVMIDCAPRALVSLLEDYGAEERITIVNAAVALERSERHLRGEGGLVPSFDLGREQARVCDHLFDLLDQNGIFAIPGFCCCEQGRHRALDQHRSEHCRRGPVHAERG